ncbi:Protein IMPACT [Grifola frondosa]|uniref:Protein IMPACT n=1 Tax=Grifola frondosa TaxID=5627 RepID=A0A1C7MCV7_GRIFR|nr:Protein IMPACT [Grifola frondosa]
MSSSTCAYVFKSSTKSVVVCAKRLLSSAGTPVFRHRLGWETSFRRRCYANPASKPLPEPAWTSISASSEITLLKSTFKAFAARILPDSASQLALDAKSASGFVSRLRTHIAVSEPRTESATHAMYAWRLSQSRIHGTGYVPGGSSNGGESGAGERLERLLQLARCEDVVLIVFRWHGGVNLGSDRWRLYFDSCEGSLQSAGFIGPRDAGKGGAQEQIGDKKTSRKKKRR